MLRGAPRVGAWELHIAPWFFSMGEVWQDVCEGCSKICFFLDGEHRWTSTSNDRHVARIHNVCLSIVQVLLSEQVDYENTFFSSEGPGRRCWLRAVSWMGKGWQRSLHDTGTTAFILSSLLDQSAHLQLFQWCCWRSPLLSRARYLQEGSNSSPELSRQQPFAHRISRGQIILWNNHHATLRHSWTLRVMMAVRFYSNGSGFSFT